MDTAIRTSEFVTSWPELDRLHAARGALPRDLIGAKIIGFVKALLEFYDELERKQTPEERAYTEAGIKLAMTRLRMLNAEHEATR